MRSEYVLEDPVVKELPSLTQIERSREVRIKLTEATLHRWNRFNDFVLKDHGSVMRSFRELFLLPNIVVELADFDTRSASRDLEKPESSPKPDYPARNFLSDDPDDDWDIPMNTESHVAGNPDFPVQNGHPPTMDSDQGFPSIPVEASEDYSDSNILSSQGHNTEPYQPKYSRRAKFINMKELKRNMMEILLQESMDTSSSTFRRCIRLGTVVRKLRLLLGNTEIEFSISELLLHNSSE